MKRFALLSILLITAWLLTMVELTTLVSYDNGFTAGELLAWVTANGYEVSDITNYCLRFVLPYWIVCSLIYAGIGVCVGWMCMRSESRKAHLAAAAICCLLLLPFVIPGTGINLFRETACVIRQVRAIDRHKRDNTGFAYHALRGTPADKKEVYVLSLGESVRYKNLSLNGQYGRETTPLLKEQSNLVLFSDYYANATLTQHALPMLLTDAQTDCFSRHFSRKTVAAAFAEAGFTTALVCHRAQLMNNGYHDYLSQDFDTLIFVEHDSLIAPALAQLANATNHLFVVTHYLGNHMFYTNRTDDCIIWRPDYNEDPKGESDSLFLNAYDNSLLYTDRLLNKEIETLKQTHRMAAWLFVADHGEYISPKVSGHGHTYHPTKEEYHVPLMVWYSDEYKETYPEKVANMIRHKDEPVSADHVFWSVLDMAGIRIDSTMQQKEMSVLGEQLKCKSRTLLLPDGETILEL